MPQENVLSSPIENVSGNEPTAWELRNEWRKAYNTCKRIRAHVSKIQDGRHTLLSDNGITLLLDELETLTLRMKVIESVFKVKRWAL